MIGGKRMFQVGDKVEIYGAFGYKKIGTSVVTEITSGNNVRIRGYKQLYRQDGSPRKKFDWEDGHIKKAE